MPHTDSAYVHNCATTFQNPTLAFRIDHNRKHGSATRFNDVETQSRTILVKHGEPAPEQGRQPDVYEHGTSQQKSLIEHSQPRFVLIHSSSSCRIDGYCQQ
jgi:hypothetical protein